MGSGLTHSRALEDTRSVRIHTGETQWLRDGRSWVSQVSDVRLRCSGLRDAWESRGESQGSSLNAMEAEKNLGEPRGGAGRSLVLFYTVAKWIPAIGGQLKSRRVVGIS